MATNGEDPQPDIRWLTYEEAGRQLGIGPDSVARKARRLGWSRQPGNDGRARVAVPADTLDEAAQAANAPERATAFLAFLKEQLKRERERVDRLEQQLDHAEAERDTARIRCAAAEAATLAARQQVERLETAQQTVQQELAAWTRGGPLVRAWRAFWYQRD